MKISVLTQRILKADASVEREGTEAEAQEIIIRMEAEADV